MGSGRRRPLSGGGAVPASCAARAGWLAATHCNHNNPCQAALQGWSPLCGASLGMALCTCTGCCSNFFSAGGRSRPTD